MSEQINQIIYQYKLNEEKPETSIRKAAAQLRQLEPGRWANDDSAKTAIVRHLRKIKNMPAHQNGGQKNYITEAELRQKYDIRAIVMHALGSIPEKDKYGERVFYPDAEFVRQFGLQGRTGYRSVLEDSPSAPYRGRAQGRTIWGHPRSIQLMKDEGVLL